MIDWAEVRRQVAERGEALRRVLDGDAAWTATLGHERALSLAQPLTAAEDAGAETLLILRGAAGCHALPAAAVARVELLAGCTPVPRAPPELLGLAFLAGERWLLFDLDRLGGGGSMLPLDQGHAVLLRHPVLRVGLRCHRAENLVPGDRRAELAPAAGLAYVRGLLPDRTALLDAAALLNRVAQGV